MKASILRNDLNHVVIGFIKYIEANLIKVNVLRTFTDGRILQRANVGG